MPSSSWRCCKMYCMWACCVCCEKQHPVFQFDFEESILFCIALIVVISLSLVWFKQSLPTNSSLAIISGSFSNLACSNSFLAFCRNTFDQYSPASFFHVKCFVARKMSLYSFMLSEFRNNISLIEKKGLKEMELFNREILVCLCKLVSSSDEYSTRFNGQISKKMGPTHFPLTLWPYLT